ncbi:histidine kinase [Actinotalea sp. M2MS4P-6]|uniref:sensor histidine kinase n=1 Tax=Actinotalea sp. M2MS4P-6 TaxID=2983762 RepID=UPI0021E44058|nr:histidine kinase [Actinotalea sp. M2MS4P-6]MCV2395844.1 histidine kinase [Actinotalea sp. M2MS4P-6]
MRWWDRLSAWDRSHTLLVDGGAVLLWLLFVSVATAGTSVQVWAIVPALPLVVRRRLPVTSVVAVYGVVLLHLLTGLSGSFSLSPGDVLVLAALGSVTLHGPRWAYRTALVSAFAGFTMLAVVAWLSGAGPGTATAMAIAAGLLGLTTFALALLRRSRREKIDALTERAGRLEAERDQQAVLATAAERTRIAREMHDIVAHSLSVMIAQADGGRYAAGAEPEAAVRALATISETGRAALADMRKLLGVLRADDEESRAELRPQPVAEQVAELVDQVRGSGLAVSLVRMGEPRTLPPGTGLSVYRVCQESLTNVLKHAGPQARATVLVQWTPRSLVLEVSDDGRGAAAADDGAGHGVTGMRERVAMLGGTLSVGPRPGGGFRVRAEVPLPPTREAVQ